MRRTQLALAFDEYTRALGEVIQEVTADPATYRGAEIMPENPIGVSTIDTVIDEGAGGLTNEHLLGTDPKLVQRPGERRALYKPGFFRELFRLDEETILFLRDYASSMFQDRGVRREINRIVMKGSKRIAARMEKLRWDALLNGTFVWLNQTVDFQVPAGNRVTPSTAWTDTANSTPLDDLRLWLSETYVKYNVIRIYMNRHTANLMLSSDSVQTLLRAVGGRVSGPSGNDPSELLSFFFPGSPPIEVYNGWYQTESLSGDKLVLSAPVHFIPDGLIYFHHMPLGDQVGDVTLTPNLQTGSVDAPGSGSYIIMDDKTEERRDNPFVQIIAGFNGGPRLFRGMDVLTADVD